jgi:hypothetical protein
MPATTSSATSPVKSASLTLALENQNLESINRIVASIVGKSGCKTCGRLLNLDFQFQSDPGPDFSGVVSVETEGF